MSDNILDTLYVRRDTAGTRALYDGWAATYENEVGEKGYVTPGRCADALKSYVSDLTTPILDVGCGTGLSGLAFRLAGFEVLDGIDLSAEMLAKAREKDVYRSLTQSDADTYLTHPDHAYAVIAAVGVIGIGAAPISVFDTLMNALKPGGLLVFSFNDHALADPQFEARVQDWIDRGHADLRFREHGEHLPGIELKANVYIVEKH